MSMLNKILKTPTKLEWLIFAYLFIGFSYFYNSMPGWNVNTRMDLIYAIVNTGHLDIGYLIEKPGYETMDLALYKGQYYCDKSPILSFLGVPVFWVWGQLSDVLGRNVPDYVGRYWVTLFTVGLYTSALGALMFRFTGFWRKDPPLQLLVSLLAVMGTMLLPYGTLFMSHNAAACFAFLSYFIIYAALKNRESWGKNKFQWVLLGGGFTMGMAVSIENPVGIVMLGMLVYLFYRLPVKKEFAWFLYGLFFGLILPMPYNWACFGSPFTSGYKYEVDPYFRTEMAQGLMGVKFPQWHAFWGITFSTYRGLFFSSPVMLLGFYGIYRLIRDTQKRADGLLIAYILVGFILFNSSYFAWWGGWSIGPRHIIPMIPFVVLSIYAVLPRWKYPVIGLGSLSVLIMMAHTLTDPQVRDNLYFPLKEFAIPNLIDGKFQYNVMAEWGLNGYLSTGIWCLFVIGGAVYLFSQAFALARSSEENS